MGSYDKKMLWRANLYIDEGTGVDWNEVHPWNAPADSGKKIRKNALDLIDSEVATVSPWWSEAWGYNEWNRAFSLGQAFNPGKTVGLAHLPVSDGKQVVVFAAFTPARSLKTPSGIESAKNYIDGTVSYSYPKHGYETTKTWASSSLQWKGERGVAPAAAQAWDNGSTGNPGSMDSLFDFVWKMRQQADDIEGDTIGFRAPGNSWWNYIVAQPNAGLGSALPASDIRYIPGLGLYLYQPWYTANDTWTNATEANDPDAWTAQASGIDYTSAGVTIKIVYLDGAAGHQQRRNASWIVEAGTDCIGFAQRAASYSGRSYAWVPLPKGLMEEAGEVNIYSVMDRYHVNTVPIGYHVYPIAERSTTYGDTVVSRIVMSGNPLQQSNAVQPMIEALRRIVPGDIFVKDSTSELGTETNDHIAIVASVPADPFSITDPLVYMDQIILIEGEYVDKIQSVIKKLGVGMYNSNEIDSGIPIYGDAFITPKDEDAIHLNCQAWAIRRLK